jgi:hypothetical protein
MSRPVRPAARVADAAKVAAQLESGGLDRLVVKLPALTKREIKARAAKLGISVAAYFVRLARRDGVEVPEMHQGDEDA